MKRRSRGRIRSCLDYGGLEALPTPMAGVMIFAGGCFADEEILARLCRLNQERASSALN